MSAIATPKKASPMPMDVDFDGRLNKVKPGKAKSINALFEAIANAFDATEDLGSSGRITILILKRDGRMFQDEKSAPKYELDGYENKDNGIGFTDTNLAHFLKADTTNKPGGLGVGRFTWLHVFDHAQIDSTYDESGVLNQRSFVFSRANSGVKKKHATPAPAATGAEVKTVIRLASPKKDREPLLTSNVTTLAGQILEHFLPYFAAIGTQSVRVCDSVRWTPFPGPRASLV